MLKNRLSHRAKIPRERYNSTIMLQYPHIDPEIVRFGPLAIRWYGVMYLLGFAASFFLVKKQLNDKRLSLPHDYVESLFTWLILGLLLGARIGHILFYGFSFYLQNPAEMIAIWHGGMSFHGGFIGSAVAGYLFCRKTGQDFWTIADAVLVTAPIGLGFGRMGNFINGELYGRITDVPWAMIFPDGGPHLRHPSQLYEVLLEGVALFIILWTVRGRFSKSGMVSAVFSVLYGIFRITAEFFREPEVENVFGIITMGQFLSLFMIVAGIWLYRHRQNTAPDQEIRT